MPRSDQDYPQQPLFPTGLAGRCPRCGEGRVFSGYLSVAERCSVCGLDLDFADAADGPAVFVILVVGLIVVAAAAAVELAFQPPYWLHLMFWLPLILILSLGLLRPLKGLLIVQQYLRRAEEGKLDRGAQ